MTRLEDQALVPMFGEHPIELGLQQPGTALLARLRADARYRRLFATRLRRRAGSVLARARHPGAGHVRADDRVRAIALRSLPHRARRHGDFGRGPPRRDAVFQPAAVVLPLPRRVHLLRRRGLRRPPRRATVEFHNTGLYNLAGALSYPAPNTGLYEITRKPEDVGKFKAPTLRNIAVTAPYMHDGSVATLEEVIAHYAAGGRTIASGPTRASATTIPTRARAFAALRSARSSARI